MKASITDLADTAQAVTEELESLPDDAEGIANVLRKLSIKALSVNGYKCPLATYLQKRVKIPKGIEVFVGHDYLLVEGGKFDIHTELPTAVKEFIRKVTLTKQYADLVVGI